jgi:ubiquinone/menaquinone biosynthesis C-methylase UbiE
MEPKLQRRIQRYGWDLAADHYETLWQAQLAPAQVKLLACAALAPGKRVLDVACGTGLVTFEAARAVGETGSVLGVDISGEMVDAARERARELRLANVELARMDAETLALPEASFDIALCALGLMYVPSPMAAIREMRRVLRPGGRVVLAVWGERARCGWSPVFPIVDAEVSSEVCPLFFHLGQQDSLADLCAQAGFERIENHRLVTTLTYRDAHEACDAAFVGGPVALAWSRFDTETRTRVRGRYIDAIAQWRVAEGYALPGEFVVTAAVVPRSQRGD